MVQSDVADRGSFNPILVLFVLLHGALLLHDLHHPEAVLTGDRSIGRLESIERLDLRLSAGESIGSIVAESHAGDYLLHYPAYALAGERGIVVMQIVIQLLATYLLFRLCVHLFGSQRIATVAAIIYTLLPGTLFQTHTVTTEAIFNPLVLATMFLAIRGFESGGTGSLLAASVVTSLACLIRPVYLLFPLIVAALLVMTRGRRGLALATLYVLIPWTIIGAAMGYNYTQSGVFSLGMGTHGLSSNLYVRAERMAGIAGFEIEPNPADDRPISVSQFLGHVVRHPAAYLQTVVSDAGNVILNSGINSFAGRYLKLYELPESTSFFRRIRDEVGWLGLVRVALETSPTMALLNLAAGVTWLGILVCAATGGVLLWRSETIGREVKLLLLGLPVYFVVVSQAAQSIRWSHRTPGEFVLALLVALAIGWMAGWCGRGSRRDSLRHAGGVVLSQRSEP